MIKLYQCRPFHILIGLFITLLMSFSVFSQPSEKAMLAKLKLTVDNQQVIIYLLDTSASHQLLTQLPLTLNFSDFASAEKIAYLPEKLTTNGMQSAANVAGDFTYYAPWGNIAIFYRGVGHDGSLYTLGKIEFGREVLATLKQNFTAILSREE